MLSCAFYGSCACPACVGGYLIDSGGLFTALLAGLARRATYFSLLRQRNLRKRKATLLSASLRFATGSLRYSLQAGSAQTRLRLKQRAALIRLKLRSSAQTEGLGRTRDRNPYCPFSPWEKAGMKASGGRAPAGFCLKNDKTRLQLFTGTNSQNPHPSLLPEREGGIPKAPSPLVPLASCPLSSPPPVLAGPVLRRKSGIRAARCLSHRRVCADPRFCAATQVARSEAQGPRQPGRLSLPTFFGEAKKVGRPPGETGQQLSAKPTTEASK